MSAEDLDSQREPGVGRAVGQTCELIDPRVLLCVVACATYTNSCKDVSVTFYNC